jgi:hypothetical protein
MPKPKRKGPARGSRRKKSSAVFMATRKAVKDGGKLLGAQLTFAPKSVPGPRSKAGAPVCNRPPAGTPKAQLQDLHDAKMKWKAGRSMPDGPKGANFFSLYYPATRSAAINRRTGKPHEGKREIAKRRGRSCKPHVAPEADHG